MTNLRIFYDVLLFLNVQVVKKLWNFFFNGKNPLSARGQMVLSHGD